MNAGVRVVSLMLGAGILLFPAAASAQQIVPDSGDTAWMLGASALVLLVLLPGLALYYGGRAMTSRGAAAVGLGVFAIVATVSLIWVLIGYSLAFSPTGSPYIGDSYNAMLTNLGMVRGNTTVPESAFALYHMLIACFAAALAAGAVIDRARLGWLIVFASLWTLIVYAPIAHWMWGGGWLAAQGALDFAGGAVVHIAAGVSALVTALMVGKGEEPTDSAKAIDGFSGFRAVPLLAGAAMLWVGWSGLTGGSELAASDDATFAIITTHVAACAAVLVTALLEKLFKGEVTASGIAAGALAGLVTATAGAGYIGLGAAMLSGAIGAAACYFAASAVQNRIGRSDVNAIFATSAVGGMIGMVLTPIFLAPALGGTGYDGRMSMASQLVAQAIAIGVIIAWAALGTFLCAFVANLVGQIQRG